MILIDDLGYRDLSCYGSEFYETPHIDAIAESGMLFTDGYAACPVCSPTRASIMSGKYPANVGVTDWIDHGNTHPAHGLLVDAPYIKYLPLDEKSIATSLREQGYKTWHVGKWHLGQDAYYPEKHGFDINIGGCHYGHPYRGYFSPYGIPTLEDGAEGENLTDRLTNEAITLIKNSDNLDEHPFFLNLCYYAVHTPIEAKEDDINKYIDKRKSMGIDSTPEFEVGEHFPCHHKKDMHVTRRVIQSNATYAAMIENLDRNIGRLIESIKEKGIEEDTLLVFTSDNGGLSTAESSPTCNAPLKEGKGWMYEGGTRVPLIIKWPGHVNKGTVCHEPITSPDFYPTFLEVAGCSLKAGQYEDGESLIPLLLSKRDTLVREAIFWHYPHYGNQGGTPGSSIRMGDYKLLEFYETGHIELFNLRKDIEEENNLAPQMTEKVELMRKRLDKWRKDIEAKIPQPYKETV